MFLIKLSAILKYFFLFIKIYIKLDIPIQYFTKKYENKATSHKYLRLVKNKISDLKQK